LRGDRRSPRGAVTHAPVVGAPAHRAVVAVAVSRTSTRVAAVGAVMPRSGTVVGRGAVRVGRVRVHRAHHVPDRAGAAHADTHDTDTDCQDEAFHLFSLPGKRMRMT